MKKQKNKKLLGALIVLLIAAAMFVSVFFFLEIEIPGVVCYLRKFYPTPWDAMERGGQLTYAHTEYGLDAETPYRLFQVDESNAVCCFLCHDVVILEELYTRDGGCRVVGSETILSYDKIRQDTELGSLSYTELLLLLPNGRYGRKCAFALRAEAVEALSGASVFPLEVEGETWTLIVTDPK
jgi:hypothetical protein